MLRDIKNNFDEEALENKKRLALKLLGSVKNKWQSYLNNFDKTANEFQELSEHFVEDTILDLIKTHKLRISWKSELKKPLEDIFTGREYIEIRELIYKKHQEVLKSRLFVALHMHAGDGNIHTNIPVNSDNYEMMQEAQKIVARVMDLAKSLDGVISGEHGIGITKMEFLEPSAINTFAEYKNKVDPNGNFNRGKLLPGSGLMNACLLYTSDAADE